MHKLATCLSTGTHRLLDRLPWFRKLLQYSFAFFLVKGLLWTALVVYPLMRGFANL